MEMTVRDLMKHLEQYDGHQVVRLATQQSWPFEYDIANVADVTEVRNEMREHLTGDELEVFDESHVDEDGKDNVVYIFEGTQLGYLPAGVKYGWG